MREVRSTEIKKKRGRPSKKTNDIPIQDTDRIFRRSSLKTEPVKKKKTCNRQRNEIINFRVSPEERKRIEARIAATGLTRQSYFIQSCLYQTILVKGSTRTFKAISKKLEEISSAIDRTGDLGSLSSEERESLSIILEIIGKLYPEQLADE